MRSPAPIVIVATCDDLYVILLAALIKSIEEHIRPGQPVTIFIIEDKITSANKQKLQLSVNNSITTLIWKKMDGAIQPGIKLPLDRSTFPLNIYMRLFVSYFIPAGIEKILYLDVDMIVQKDITILFENDLGNYMIGAVADPRVTTFNNAWGGILNYSELGFQGSTKYFNTGLLLINTRMWRDQNIAEKVIDCIKKNKKYANYPDQYGLNVVLANQWLALDPLWNQFSTMAHDAPYLIHFVQRKPIYKSYHNVEVYKQLFYSYLDKTEWRNFKPIGRIKQYVKKSINILAKFI